MLLFVRAIGIENGQLLLLSPCCHQINILNVTRMGRYDVPCHDRNVLATRGRNQNGAGQMHRKPGGRMTRRKMLILCTGNSCRSQMAEGWVRALKGDLFDVWSAGIEKHGMNPFAIQVMAEAGVDISAHWSKLAAELPEQEYDYIVTVCGHASENCPYFPGSARRVHAGFDDPPRLAKDAKTEEEALGHYRRVRDEIRRWAEGLPDTLG